MDADSTIKIRLCSSCVGKFSGLAARIVSVRPKTSGLVRMSECAECGKIKPVQEFEIRKRRAK